MSSAVRVAITSFSWMPSKRRISPAKRNVSPGDERLDEIFLDLAEHAPAAAGEAGAAIARDADVEERRLDDGADVQPVLLGDARMGDPPEAVGALA